MKLTSVFLMVLFTSLFAKAFECSEEMARLGEMHSEQLRNLNFQTAIKDSFNLAKKIVEESQTQVSPSLVANLSPQTDKIRLVYSGPPSGAKLVEFPEKTLFSHFRSGHRIQKIKEKSTIVAGPVPYVFAHSHYEKETYKDMTGIFLTTPEFAPFSVGTHEEEKVDLYLPPGVGVIQFEPGIYMIPGKPGELEIPVRLVETKPR